MHKLGNDISGEIQYLQIGLQDDMEENLHANLCENLRYKFFWDLRVITMFNLSGNLEENLFQDLRERNSNV